MTRRDLVTPEVREFVLRRDRQCILFRMDEGHRCRDRFGNLHSAFNTDRLTLEHVKSELRMGRRAPSDPAHLVAMCHAGNVGVPSKEQRAAIREYLRRVTA